jgi:hypothetical protein
VELTAESLLASGYKPDLPTIILRKRGVFLNPPFILVVKETVS